MIWSVSMLSPRTKALPVMIFFIVHFVASQPVRSRERQGLLQPVSRIADGSHNRAGRHGQRAGEVNSCLTMTHAPGEIAVSGADATHRSVQSAERVAWTAQACGTRRLADLGAG